MDKDIITTDEILGKEVIDKKGEIIGILQQIHVNKKTKEIVGVTVDEGFMKPDLYIGIENVKLFGVDSVLLNISPEMTFKGLIVFDSNGKKIGSIQRIFTSNRSSKIKSIEIKEKMKTFTIEAKYIRSIGDNVILKENYLTKEE